MRDSSLAGPPLHGHCHVFSACARADCDPIHWHPKRQKRRQEQEQEPERERQQGAASRKHQAGLLKHKEVPMVQKEPNT